MTCCTPIEIKMNSGIRNNCLRLSYNTYIVQAPQLLSNSSRLKKVEKVVHFPPIK